MTSSEQPATKDTVCQTCRNTLFWHESNRPRHPFRSWNHDPVRLNPKSDSKFTSESRTSPLLDPVLRLILLEKGVITAREIEDATAALSAAVGDVRAPRQRERGGE